MTETPIDVRVAKAIGEMTMLLTDGRWRVKHVVTDAGGTIHEMWIHVPPYSTDPAAAWQALEAWRTKRGRADFTIESYETGYEIELWVAGRKVAEASADTMPAAVCAAIIAAEQPKE